MPNLFPPKVTAITQTVELNETLPLHKLYTWADLDAGATIEKIRVRDGSLQIESGAFVLDNVVQPANTWIEVDAADFNKLRYRSAFKVHNEAFSIMIFDGKFWSEASEGRLYTVARNRVPPFLTATAFSIQSSEAQKVEELLTATDPDGYPMTKYAFVDRSGNHNGGFFSLRGVRLASARWHQIDADDLPFLRYIGGQFAQTENVAFRSFDGRFWSPIAEVTATTEANTSRPTIEAFDFKIGTGETTLVSNLYKFTDPDGNTLKRIQIFDTGVLAAGGFFSLNGVRIPAGSWFTVEAKDFGKLFYNASATADSERWRIRGFDSRFWSPNVSALIESVPKPDFVVSHDVSIDELEDIAFSSVASLVGGGPPVTKVQVVDLGEGALSGRLTTFGSALQQGVVHELTAAEFAALGFRGGSADNGREFDRVIFRASNGTSWSDWQGINFNTDAVGARAVDVGPGADWAAGGGTTNLTYTFIDRIPFYYADDSDEAQGNPGPLTGAQKAKVREALAMFETLLDINFVERPNHSLGDLTFGLADDDDGVLGHAYLPVPAGPGLPGDVWLNQLEQDIIDMNAEGYLTIIHEIGHALGLAHSFEGSAILPAPTENQRYSMMSYNRPAGATAEQRAITPMLYDLVALQADYGANMSYNAGHTQIRLPVNFDKFQILWDAGGVDTFNITPHTTNSVIDLRQGRFSSLGNLTDNVVVAYNTVIEYARGGSGDDIINGNDENNSIWGNEGNDILRGFGGTDVLQGGEQSDKYIYDYGGGFDRINENSKAGRDILEIHGFGKFNDFTEDLSFRRLGRDLRVELTVDGGQSHGGVTITNMLWGGSRVEQLQLFGADGTQMTERIDLKAIFDQATADHQQFRLTEFNSRFGIIAVPV